MIRTRSRSHSSKPYQWTEQPAAPQPHPNPPTVFLVEITFRSGEKEIVKASLVEEHANFFRDEFNRRNPDGLSFAKVFTVPAPSRK